MLHHCLTEGDMGWGTLEYHDSIDWISNKTRNYCQLHLFSNLQNTPNTEENVQFSIIFVVFVTAGVINPIQTSHLLSHDLGSPDPLSSDSAIQQGATALQQESSPKSNGILQVTCTCIMHIAFIVTCIC